ncbi:hypothetical protein HY224_03360 [Candidatus Uhrbacteria bacterium]|nr:hypothetical protein [Candidatus Uhrbacteria bacterium]
MLKKLHQRHTNKALFIQALLCFIVSLMALISWVVIVTQGYYLVSPFILWSFFLLDVFFLLPMYMFSGLAILFQRYDLEVLAMFSGLAIFCTRLAFLLGSLTGAVSLDNITWLFIFLVLPVQAWIFSLYLGRHLEVMKWGLKLTHHRK